MVLMMTAFSSLNCSSSSARKAHGARSKEAAVGDAAQCLMYAPLIPTRGAQQQHGSTSTRPTVTAERRRELPNFRALRRLRQRATSPPEFVDGA